MKGEKSKSMSSENDAQEGAKDMKAEGREDRDNGMKAEGREDRDGNMKAEGREDRNGNMKAETKGSGRQVPDHSDRPAPARSFRPSSAPRSPP